jgi:hypothetical protein
MGGLTDGNWLASFIEAVTAPSGSYLISLVGKNIEIENGSALYTIVKMAFYESEYYYIFELDEFGDPVLDEFGEYIILGYRDFEILNGDLWYSLWFYLIGYAGEDLTYPGGSHILSIYKALAGRGGRGGGGRE